MRTKLASLFFVTLATTTSCTARVGSELEVPEDAGQTCADHCQSIGMRLTAVAIMANNVGCVCEVAPDSAIPVSHHTSTAAGGMTAVLMEEEQNRQNQQSQTNRTTY